MTTSDTNPLQRALYRILRPLARLLLRNGIPFAEFAELMKRAYVDAALEDFSDKRKKPTDSRAAVMTGLTRKEVKKQREIVAGEQSAGSSVRRENRASRVVSGWVHDPDFQASDGEPAQLSFDGALGFSELVRRYSGDMTPRAVLEELVRVGVVADDGSGNLTLRLRAYVPAGDSEEMLLLRKEQLQSEIEQHESSIETLEKQLNQVNERLAQLREEQQSDLQEAMDILESVPWKEDNNAIQQWAEDLEMDERDLINQLEDYHAQ